MERTVIMGAGEVGRYLARRLSSEGQQVTLIDSDPTTQRLVEEQLDVSFVAGNGAQVPTLEAARVADCSLFVAASSSDEANLAASLLAKRCGATRTVVRVSASEDITQYGRIYEKAFAADLLLSTQLLTTTRILNSVLGYNTLDVEYLANGQLQLRRIHVEPGSILHERPLAEVRMPRGSLVLAFLSKGEVVVPRGTDRARPGDDALILAATPVIDDVERRVSHRSGRLARVTIAGGGSTAEVVVRGLERQASHLRIIEINRHRAEELAEKFPDHEIIHGDATDMSLLEAEGAGAVHTFLALTGNDETNLMACLLAQELGAERLTALVQKSETSSLWKKVGLIEVVSPRIVAAERIREYVANGYESRIVSLENGAAKFIQRQIHTGSAAAGAKLADVQIPQGLIVAAVVRGGKAEVPSGEQRLQAGDEVILLVREAEMPLAQLVFPGPERD